jgi:hypothetical protein
MRMRYSLVVRASDCQCTGPTTHWNRGAAAEAVLNKVRKTNSRPSLNLWSLYWYTNFCCYLTYTVNIRICFVLGFLAQPLAARGKLLSS